MRYLAEHVRYHTQGAWSVRGVFGALIVLWTIRVALVAPGFIETHPSHGLEVVLMMWSTVVAILAIVMGVVLWVARRWADR